MCNRGSIDFSVEWDDCFEFSVSDFDRDDTTNKSGCPTNKIRKVCKTPGVYAIFQKDGNCMYVGVATDLSGRLLQHIRGKSYSWIHDKPGVHQYISGDETIKVWITSRFMAAILEHILIKDLNPKLNVAT